jgi:hypothetical protein
LKHFIYVVTAYRWGDLNEHGYVVTATSKKHRAIKLAEEEENRRGFKYECQVIEVEAGTSCWETDPKIIRHCAGKILKDSS